MVPPIWVPPTRRINGSRNDLVNWLTTAANAVPITMPTARSTTFPRRMKSLKPRSMSLSLHYGPPEQGLGRRPRHADARAGRPGIHRTRAHPGGGSIYPERWTHGYGPI